VSYGVLPHLSLDTGENAPIASFNLPQQFHDRHQAIHSIAAPAQKHTAATPYTTASIAVIPVSCCATKNG
jgi:hypothetical protein